MNVGAMYRGAGVLVEICIAFKSNLVYNENVNMLCFSNVFCVKGFDVEDDILEEFDEIRVFAD